MVSQGFIFLEKSFWKCIFFLSILFISSLLTVFHTWFQFADCPTPVLHLCLLPQYVLYPVSFVSCQVLGIELHVLFSCQFLLPLCTIESLGNAAQHFMLLFSFNIFSLKLFFLQHLLNSLPLTVFQSTYYNHDIREKDLLLRACQICTNSYDAASECVWFTIHAPCWSICARVDFSPKLKLHQRSRNFRGFSALLQDIC